MIHSVSVPRSQSDDPDDFLLSSETVVEKFEFGVPTLPMLTVRAYDACQPASA
ncbi:hypothetical protein PISMIDRAFT_681202, partial [Pisolithus microcarpus 441]